MAPRCRFKCMLPRRDCERKREEGDAPLGVQAPVDRVADDHRAVAVAEDPPSQLLGDEREAGALDRLQPLDHGRLGRGVDRRRLVAALAGADAGLALDAGRQCVEHATHRRRRVAADPEPVVARHSSKGEMRSPLVSLGKKYVQSPRRV